MGFPIGVIANVTTAKAKQIRFSQNVPEQRQSVAAG